MKNLYLLLVAILFISCSEKKTPRTLMDLQGQWQFATDSSNLGVNEKWFLKTLNDSINLPGTTDTNQKGFINNDSTTLHLSRPYTYEGIAWYRKKIIVPEHFKNKHIELVLERSKFSKVWIDSTLIGSSKLLQSPQQFNVSKVLTPGEHFITIQVDNSLKLTPYGNAHIYSDDTQTNWNGIIGKMYLEASPKTFISNLQVHPNIDKKKINVSIEIENALNLSNLNIQFDIKKSHDGKTTQLTPKTFKIKDNKAILEYVFKDSISLWSEFEQPLYELTATILNPESNDAKTVSFGMRNFSVNGTQFTINNTKTFLRGKHEAAVFPLTGYTPTSVEDWERIYKIAKQYGINHYRFHTYCPPEAAFIAADKTGIYLQVELPFWGGLESDTIANNLKEEGIAMLKAYANHPSFVMFSPGNEIWGGHDKIENVMLALKNYDNRPLYAMGSNNNIGYLEPRAYSQFFVGARIPTNGHSTKGHTRLTHAFADAEQGGILNTSTPSTQVNFDYAVNNMPLPLVSHEIGQYQIYPNYDEIDKYTGVLKPRNLQVFQKRLEKAGMEHLDSSFQKASGAWSAICYKAEMEAALRTKGMAGFQLLDLQDFPGQGTALVGVLDAFMESKNVITTESWKQSCNDITLLAEFSKYCWTNTESFQAQIKIANYSNAIVDTVIDWIIKDENGNTFKQDSFDKQSFINGELLDVGTLTLKLDGIDTAKKLTLNITIPNTSYSNSYPIWVYPSNQKIVIPETVLVTNTFNSTTLSNLKNGKNVLLFPDFSTLENKSVAGHFPPDFWNYGMFKSISESVKKPISPGTLGILTNPKHPIFNNFPTDYHTNWQWFSILKESRPLILDELNKAFLPTVQVIDNLERNHKLGLIFEFNVGKGNLLVCMSPLNTIKTPETVQLYQSILNYMSSDNFHPKQALKYSDLETLFNN
ncbi:sugar-binding domain-containing protein [Meridianimaribacter flavus]